MSSTLGYVITRTNHRAVEQFIERLAALGHDDWLCIARSSSTKNGERRKATVMLEQLVAQHRLVVEAWNVADDVETVIHCSLGSRGYARWSEHASFRHARDAAKTAALALLIRPLLGSQDFTIAYGPFERFIPAQAAFGSSDSGRAALVRGGLGVGVRPR